MYDIELDLYLFFVRQRDDERRFIHTSCYFQDLDADPRRLLSVAAEKEAAIRLLLVGHSVMRTEHYHTRYDLLVDDVLRVEVKASRWLPTVGGRGRYQCYFHNQADVILWLLADVGRWVVIPVPDLGGRRNLAIWSYDPDDYTGQWARYLGAWEMVKDLVATHKRAVVHQAHLF